MGLPFERSSRLAAFVFAFALTTSGAVASEWATLPSSPDAGSNRHEDVWFTDEYRGWVVNGNGQIWHTPDGGNSWQIQKTLSEFLRAVTFVSPLHGWVGTLFSQSRLYETTDGGESWNVVVGLPAEMPLGICGMWAASDDVVVAVGRYFTPAGVLKTTDAGGSWSFLDVSSQASTLVDCYFPTEHLGFAVGSVGSFPESSRAVVLRTTDGGAAWETRHVSSRMGEWAWKISFPSASFGYVSIERASGPMTILKTMDGGVTWTEVPCPNSNEQGIGFLSDQMGWLGGWESPTYSTTNGGESWQTLNQMENLNRIRFVGGGRAYAVGSRVYRYGPSPTSVPVMPASVVGMLSESTPNPFSTSASIAFTLSHPARVRLDVFDVSGRWVRTISSGPAEAGVHHAVWNGRDPSGMMAPTGVYFWRLKAENRSESRKMLFVR